MEKPSLPSTKKWSKHTTEWFNSWRDSPRTDDWDDVQWRYLFDTALVHNKVWGSGAIALMGELRIRLSYLGLTFDVAKATVKIVDSKKVTPLDEIRKRREKRGTPTRRTRTSA
jgi:hypothetical protein